MRFVLDTNLLVSGVIAAGLPRRLVVVVPPVDEPRIAPTDPGDDHIIATAVAGKADVIASGDKRDLLLLGSFQGNPIITAGEAFERPASRGHA